MPRPWLGTAPTTATKLWLPLWDRDIADYSGNAQAVTSTADSGAGPTYNRGPALDALTFGTVGDVSRYVRLEVAQSASLDISGAITIEAWFQSTLQAVERSLIARRALNGGQNHAWALAASSSAVTFSVYDSGGVADTLTLTVGRQFVTGAEGASRWMHIRAVFDPSAFLYVFLDGELWGKKDTVNGNLQTTTLGPIQIGAETSTVTSSQWSGSIADISIRNVADTDIATLAPNVRPDRVTRRHFVTVDMDIKENAAGDSWTNDGAGGFWLALSALSLGTFVVGHGDIVAVTSKTSSTATAFAEVGNVTDLDAASNSYFLDQINSRIYSSEDPSVPHSFEIQIRVRLSTFGLLRAGRYYAPALLSGDAGERRFANWDEDYPTGGGGQLVLAAQHPRFPAGWVNEEATAVIWTNSRVNLQLMSDGIPWAYALPLFFGFIDQPPADERDTLTVTTVQESARFFRAQVTEQIADRATWPNLEDAAIGYRWPFLLGRGHARVPVIMVNKVPQTIGGVTNLCQFKICDMQIARVERLMLGWSVLSNVQTYSGDLSTGTFYIKNTAITPWPPEGLSADVDGLASTGATWTGPNTFPLGSSATAYVTPKDLLQQILIRYFGLSTSDFNATWAATEARITTWRRQQDPMGDVSAFLSWLRRHLAETLTVLYFDLTDRQWAWEDVDKSEAIEFVLYDRDLIAEEWVADKTRLAKRANARPYTYSLAEGGGPPELLIGADATTLALKADARHGAKGVWEPEGGNPCGFLTKGDTDAWLARVRTFLEGVEYYHHVTVSARFASIEQMAVVNNQTSRRPSGAGNRYRVLSVHPQADGTIAMTLFSERLWPGTSTVGNSTRAAWAPAQRLSWGDSSGPSLATAGAWTPVGTHYAIFGGAKLRPPNKTDRFLAYGQRVGGAADSDCQLRIRDIDTGATIATIGGFTTSAAMQASTTFANVPVADKRLEFEYLLAGGATLTLWAANWEMMEGAGNLVTDPISPTTALAWGVRTGVSLASTAGAWTTVPGPISFPAIQAVQAPAWVRGLIYCNIGTATGLYIRLVSLSFGVFATWPQITGTGIFETIVAAGVGPPYLQYKSASGTATLYAVQCDRIMQPNPV